MNTMMMKKAPSQRSNDLAHWVDRFFDRDFFGDHLPETFRGAKFPTTNIAEDNGHFLVSCELPGLEPADIHVEVVGRTLQISGERKFEEEKKGKEYHRVESQFGSFLRTIPLPSNLVTDEIEAEYKNGVLEISIPKLEPSEDTPRKITVKKA